MGHSRVVGLTVATMKPIIAKGKEYARTLFFDMEQTPLIHMLVIVIVFAIR